MIIFGGMNNNNYLGSSFLIINLDFSYIPLTVSGAKERDHNNKDKGKIKSNLPVTKKLSSSVFMQTNQCIIKNQLGIVKDLDLPPIK